MAGKNGPDLLRALTDRLRTEAGSALLLVGIAAVALAWANSPWSASYDQLWGTHAIVGIGAFQIDMSLHEWVNDGLMVVFFFLIGLEVREELAIGSLRDRRQAVVPVIAGLLGVVMPTVIFLAIAGRDAPAAWGVVVGTDTAFLLGALALVGPRMSSQLRVFLLTLTVVDDFLAVSIIGVVYTDDVQGMPLVVALSCLVALSFLGRAREWRSAPYVLVVIVLWVATLLSGVHPSIAGMAAGLLIPAADPSRDDVVHAKGLFRDYWQSPRAEAARNVRLGLARSISVNDRLHDVLAGPVALVIVPIFALANAGVDLRGSALGDAMSSPITWGVAAGLVVGKFVGISLGTWASLRLRWGRLPQGVGMGSVCGGAALSGLGFTMSLLIISLSLDGQAASNAIVGVLIAMVLSGLFGWGVFAFARGRLGETSADLPMQLADPVDVERDHTRGNPEADIVVVEYLDFECPFCARATGMWRDLEERYGSDGGLYVVRHLPLVDVHPHAMAAAIAAEAAARQGRFWEMHDVLFENQQHLEDADLRGYAAQLGLDLERFDSDRQADAVLARIREDMVGAAASGARGTPTFFLNGHRHTGAHDARSLIRELDAPRVPRRRGT